MNSVSIHVAIINKNAPSQKQPPIIKNISEINSTLVTYKKYISKVNKIAKYDTKNNSLSALLEKISSLSINKDIYNMYKECIENANLKLAADVYNTLLQKWGMLNINITTAGQLSNLEKSELILRIQEDNKNIANINIESNPKIINGKIVLVNSYKIDSSALGKIETIRSRFASEK